MGNKSRNITSATTTVVKSGRGTLIAIINNKITASSVVTIYDNTAASGTKIGTITSPSTLLQSQYNQNFYRVDFSIGLTIVTSTADDITVIYE